MTDVFDTTVETLIGEPGGIRFQTTELEAGTRAFCNCNQAQGSNWPCGVMVARLTTNQEVVVSSTTSVIFFLLRRFGFRPASVGSSFPPYLPSRMFVRPSSRSIASSSSLIGTRFHQASISSTRLSRYPGRSNPKFTKRASSSSIPPPDDQPSVSSPAVPNTQPTPPLPDEAVLGIEKPKRKRTVINLKSPSGDNPADSPPIRNGNTGSGRNGSAGGDGNGFPPSSQPSASLDILWSPEPHSRTSTASELQNLDLPPSEIFEDVLDNFYITLHPQTQHRATYTPHDGSATSTVEPTLALYCPIEGGDYVVDETVKELARRAGADVVVLDCVQLAAGSAGQFGSGAPSLSLACAFLFPVRWGTDYMRLTQPQMYFNYPIIPFISRFLPRLHHHRLLRGVLHRLKRKMTVSFLRTSSPLRT